MNTTYEVFRNVCPRNCYNSCAMLSYVRDGKLYKVAGDPQHGFTRGKLCSKGYAYLKYVYSPNRLRFPLRQYPRGSGKWEKISWNEALEQIAEKILELNKRYGSNLSLTYNNGSGNIGLLHQYASAAFFNSLVQHTKPVGNFCLAAGQDAFTYDFGQTLNPDPEQMGYAKLILLWGANPACTAIQQMKYINAARKAGAKLVVIDPLFTSTAAKADLYIQIRPGTDGLLALGLAKKLIENEDYDREFVENHIYGFEAFSRYLNNSDFSPSRLSTVTGITEEAFYELSQLLKEYKPCSSWIGYGFQRHSNSGQSIRAINALMALTGNIGKSGAGAYYLHLGQEAFPLKLANHNSSVQNRLVNINDFASSILSLQDPPVKFIWISGRNPLSQDQGLTAWRELLNQLELIVTVDLFMTKTAEHSDLVLPAASHFEEYDLNISYWHYWLALNEKALPAYYEAKSDLEIFRLLTRKLNKLSAGFSDFPAELSAEDWLASEITTQIKVSYGINSWQDLKNGPKKLQMEIPWSSCKFRTASGKFEIYSKLARKNNLPALPKYHPPQSSKHPFQVLSPQKNEFIHSQTKWLPRIIHDQASLVLINTNDAQTHNLRDDESVILYNDNGSLSKKVQITDSVPPGVLVVFQGGQEPINSLINESFCDMGKLKNHYNGNAFYDLFVSLKKGGDSAEATWFFV